MILTVKHEGKSMFNWFGMDEPSFEFWCVDVFLELLLLFIISQSPGCPRDRSRNSITPKMKLFMIIDSIKRL